MAHVSFHQTDLKRHAVVEVCAHMKEEGRERLINIVLSAGHAVTFLNMLDARGPIDVCANSKIGYKAYQKPRLVKCSVGLSLISDLHHTIGTLKCLPDNLLYF